VLIAALGDSITAGAPLWDPDPRVRERLADALNSQSQYEYWATRRLGARFRNCGVFGERTDQIARRLDACARGADALIVQGGVNDLAQRVPVTRIAANLEQIVATARRRGLRVAIANVLPTNGGTPRPRLVAALNARIARIGTRLRVPVLDFHRALADPNHPDRMRASLTIDGIHPSVPGYRRLAQLVPVSLTGR
jgi:lysophospholipase L1-like esterase